VEEEAQKASDWVAKQQRAIALENEAIQAAQRLATQQGTILTMPDGPDKTFATAKLVQRTETAAQAAAIAARMRLALRCAAEAADMATTAANMRPMVHLLPVGPAKVAAMQDLSQMEAKARKAMGSAQVQEDAVLAEHSAAEASAAVRRSRTLMDSMPEGAERKDAIKELLQLKVRAQQAGAVARMQRDAVTAASEMVTTMEETYARIDAMPDGPEKRAAQAKLARSEAQAWQAEEREEEQRDLATIEKRAKEAAAAVVEMTAEVVAMPDGDARQAASDVLLDLHTLAEQAAEVVRMQRETILLHQHARDLEAAVEQHRAAMESTADGVGKRAGIKALLATKAKAQAAAEHAGQQEAATLAAKRASEAAIVMEEQRAGVELMPEGPAKSIASRELANQRRRVGMAQAKEEGDRRGRVQELANTRTGALSEAMRMWMRECGDRERLVRMLQMAGRSHDHHTWRWGWEAFKLSQSSGVETYDVVVQWRLRKPWQQWAQTVRQAQGATQLRAKVATHMQDFYVQQGLTHLLRLARQNSAHLRHSFAQSLHAQMRMARGLRWQNRCLRRSWQAWRVCRPAEPSPQRSTELLADLMQLVLSQSDLPPDFPECQAPPRHAPECSLWRSRPNDGMLGGAHTTSFQDDETNNSLYAEPAPATEKSPRVDTTIEAAAAAAVVTPSVKFRPGLSMADIEFQRPPKP
jgi:hypothetical protein